MRSRAHGRIIKKARVMWCVKKCRNADAKRLVAKVETMGLHGIKGADPKFLAVLASEFGLLSKAFNYR